MEYEKEQYQGQLGTYQSQSDMMEKEIEHCSVREHEIMVVTQLIDEKVRLNDEKLQMKKNCREEKARLDQELEKMRKRREDMEKEEHAQVLR